MERQRILVVDDDERWLRTIRRILGKDYHLELTTDPTVATTLVESSSYSLAILDQRITADVSGVELFARLREIRADLRAIILTGYAEVDDAVESMKSGACDYMSKGTRDLANQLRARVAKAIKHNPRGEQVLTLIRRGESGELEFKSSIRWDMQQGKMNKDLERVIVKTIAGFLNSELGGVLLIGVDDNGNVVGLEHDYKTLTRHGRDGFENFLVTLLVNAYGKDVSPLIRVDFHDIHGNDVCRVSLRPSPKAVYVPEGTGGELYIRMGNSTRRLSTQEAVEYSRMRWPALLPRV